MARIGWAGVAHGRPDDTAGAAQQSIKRHTCFYSPSRAGVKSDAGWAKRHRFAPVGRPAVMIDYHRIGRAVSIRFDLALLAHKGTS